MQIRSNWLIFLILGCTSLLLWYCSDSSASNSNPYNSPFRNLHDTVDYVGIETCKGCHSNVYHTFIETGMGQSFHEGKVRYSKADFKTAKPVYDAKANFYYYPFLRGEDVYIQEFRLGSSGDTLHNRIEKITHIIGSGHHTNSHFWTDGSHLYQAPLTYYTQKKIWDLPPGFESFNSRFGRKIDIECMSCHTGMPQTRDGSVNIFERLPLGIDCERCHGPGELHVNEKRNGILIDTSKEADYSIVNPKRLPYSLQVDICQRCHLQGNNVLKPGKKFTDFRPGMPLDSIFTVYMPKTSGAQGFVMAGHAERFQQSACFLGSNKNHQSYNPTLNFTCINCHNPHVSVRATNLTKFNQTCVGCHNSSSTRSKFKQCRNKQGIAGSNCVNCHMPASDTRDIPHVTVHDHKIQRPKSFQVPGGSSNYSSDNGFGKTTGELWCVNSKSSEISTEVNAYLSYFEKFDANPLYLSAGKKMLAKWQAKEGIDPNQGSKRFWDRSTTQTLYWLESAVHAQFVERNPQQLINLVVALQLNPDVENLFAIQDPWFYYRVANSYKQLGKWQEALVWYHRLHDLMPYDLDFTAEMAEVYIRLSQWDKAIEWLNQNLSRSPKHENSRLNLAFAYAGKQQWPLVQLWCNRTLELNPDNREAHQLLVNLLRSIGKNEEARKHENILNTIRNR